MIKDKTIEIFLDDLASKAPTPGGGSAAAILGAMGAALVSMVCNLTIGKKEYDSVGSELAITLAAAELARTKLTAMIHADVEAFDAVMAAYALPKETPAEKTARTQTIQEALKKATEVPLECAKVCAEVIDLSRIVAEKGNKNVITDAGVAVYAAYGALKSAALNVHVNAKSIKDEVFVHERISMLNSILTGADVALDEIHQEVQRRL